MSQDDVDDHRLGLTEVRYANYFKVGYNAFEFLVDFGQLDPEGGQPRFHTRIVTSPVYAKGLAELVQSSIAVYQNRFGDIPSAEDPPIDE